MYNYAQLDSNNIVFCVSQHQEEIDTTNLVLIDSYDVTLIGKEYNFSTNTFNDVPKTIDQAKQEKMAELQQKYLASYTTFQSQALGTTKTYPIDSAAQANLKDLQDRLIADPDKNVFYFKTIEDGTLVAHTRSQFLRLLEDAEAFKVAKIQQFDAYEAQINAATDIPTVDGIVISFK